MLWQKVKDIWYSAQLWYAVRKIERIETMEMALGIIRAVLAAGGGLLVNHGWADDGTVEGITGAILVISSGVWSVVNKAKAKKTLDAAKKAPAIEG